jgi:hypothetical protein
MGIPAPRLSGGLLQGAALAARHDAVSDLRLAIDLIAEVYGDRTAARSGVPLLSHISEGLVVLFAGLNATDTAKAAYALHPITQGDLVEKHMLDRGISNETWELAYAYAAAANSYLLAKFEDGKKPLFVGTENLRHMLIADKIQNRKDFIRYHKATHAKSDALSGYFDAWLKALGVSGSQRDKLTALINPPVPLNQMEKQ